MDTLNYISPTMSASREFAAEDLDSNNIPYVQELLTSFERDATSVPPAWQQYFQQLPHSKVAAPQPERSESSPDDQDGFEQNGQPLADTTSDRVFQHRVDRLVDLYRTVGHLAAELDPLGLAPRDWSALEPARHGFQDADRTRKAIFTHDGQDFSEATLEEIIERLSTTYCRTIGYQYMHIDDEESREWLQQRIETPEVYPLRRETQLRILTRLTDAVIFEQFVRKKYVGAKTFSLEGAETLIPLIDLALEAAAEQEVVEVVMGMAHRGRLNVLANVVGKRPVEIFREFEDQHPDWWRGSGDVKYHLGASGVWEAPSGHQVHLSLCFNPSHLEFVNPVALGRTRAKQDRVEDYERRKGMTLLIHGDAGFAGEGIVQESLNLSELQGYKTGGSLHVIVNNQLGFTTAPGEGRSTPYPTDVARMLQAPIFHVNGEYPQAVARAVQLAMEFRARFQRDVIIDMFCYRRWGHNEADEPEFTQPQMVQAIEHRTSIRDNYLEHLLDLGEVEQAEADRIEQQRRDELQKQFDEAQRATARPQPAMLSEIWDPYAGGDVPEYTPSTGVDHEVLGALMSKMVKPPKGFHVHKKLRRSMERRQEMAEGKRPLDWSAAEALAFASLAVERHPVRLAGQDSVRGTFSQRHAELHDVVNNDRFQIFSKLSRDQAPVEIINSPLCEAGALGYEYGYSLDRPEALILWEAQYGDFVNAAQVIIDQFLASAEDKWRRLSGLVLLLPHGFEGQGPEHSSARLERFLLLAAEDNIQVVYPSTPAQYFHCLRRQVKRNWRKPLVVLTPKSMLRHPQMVSPMEDLATGKFREVLPDSREDPERTDCILLTSGKLYYELLAAREEHDKWNFAIMRIEQFYPFRKKRLAHYFTEYSNDTPVRWVQEEPENMGAWPYWRRRFCDQFVGDRPLSVVARPSSGSPATGSTAAHKHEQQELIQRAFRELS